MKPKSVLSFTVLLISVLVPLYSYNRFVKAQVPLIGNVNYCSVAIAVAKTVSPQMNANADLPIVEAAARQLNACTVNGIVALLFGGPTPAPPAGTPIQQPPKQPTPGQPIPGQPIPGQPIPGQPIPGQPGQGQPGQAPRPPTPPGQQPPPSGSPSPAPPGGPLPTPAPGQPPAKQISPPSSSTSSAPPGGATQTPAPGRQPTPPAGQQPPPTGQPTPPVGQLPPNQGKTPGNAPNPNPANNTMPPKLPPKTGAKSAESGIAAALRKLRRRQVQAFVDTQISQLDNSFESFLVKTIVDELQNLQGEQFTQFKAQIFGVDETEAME